MMTSINWALGRKGNTRREAEAIANHILDLCLQGRIRGTFRLNDFLFQELCQELPQELVQEVMTRFQRRRARGYPKAEHFLKWDIVMAVHERDCYAHPSKSKRRKIRVDEAPVQQLSKEVPQQLVAEVTTRFQRRRARGYPKTGYLLKCDVAMTRDEGEHYARTFKPIVTIAGY